MAKEMAKTLKQEKTTAATKKAATKKTAVKAAKAKPQLSKDPKDPDELWLLEFFKDVKVETLAPSKEDIKKLADLYEKFQMKSAGNWVGCHNQRRHIMVTMYAFTNRRLTW